MRTLHLFAGAGGGLYADLIIGHIPVCAVELNHYCCSVLRERRDEGWWPGLFVWEGDVRLFDPSPWKGRVDCIHAGFPCQDLSRAGKRLGIVKGERSSLYTQVIRCVREIRPSYVFMENVSAILDGGLGRVLGDLAEVGMDARWCCLRASSVGARHHRDRWWLLAYPKGIQLETKEVVGKENSERQPRRTSINVSRKIRASRWETDQPDMVGTLHDASTWSERSKAIGNGQVPLAAAAAWIMLGGPIE